mmetsp:Transcript_21166/g.51669  ORF Transcript_21166/g.51669 Transcript_21166/m.51669 type:complete len:245 (+) Transcript_21166:3-737(+)
MASRAFVYRGASFLGASRSLASTRIRLCPCVHRPFRCKHVTWASAAAVPEGGFKSHDEFCQSVLSLSGDPLEADGGRIVIYRGSSHAKLMVIGEGPGEEEDKQGIPFVGPAGQLLDRILQCVNFNVDTDVYITNAVKRRPRNNRKPVASELAYYLPLLLEEIELVEPRVIVLAGASAMRALLDERDGITSKRGKWYERDGRPVMPIYHPSYLLRNPSRRRGSKKWETWEDIQEVRRKFDELSVE